MTGQVGVQVYGCVCKKMLQLMSLWKVQGRCELDLVSFPGCVVLSGGSVPVCFPVGTYRCHVWLVGRFGGLCIGLGRFLREKTRE